MYHMSSWDFVTTALRRGANSAHWKPEEPRLGKMRTGPRSLRDMGVGLGKGLSALRTGSVLPELTACGLWFTSLAWVTDCIVFPNRFTL